MRKLFSFVLFVLTASCAPTAPAQLFGGDLTRTPLAVKFDADLKAAAIVAERNGFPARAAYYRAVDAMADECQKAITAALPKPQDLPDGAGVVTAFELAIEAVNAAADVPAAVRLHCHALPGVIFPLK